MSVAKPIMRTCAERKLRKIGKEMHNIISRAVLAKTFSVSLLSNNNISSSELLKLMQVDMDRVMAFPEIQTYLFSNLCGVGTNIFVTIFLFGWAGLIGIVVFVATLLVRFAFKNTLNEYDEEIAEERGKRIRSTVDIFNIIKLIKVAALEMPYYRKLVDLRVSEVNSSKSKSRFEFIPMFISSLSLRLVMMVILWVSILMGK
jgi:ABC-type bacteriocin/lantibiotic exporter with double-glycine peptidase domain